MSFPCLSGTAAFNRWKKNLVWFYEFKIALFCVALVKQRMDIKCNSLWSNPSLWPPLSALQWPRKHIDLLINRLCATDLIDSCLTSVLVRLYWHWLEWKALVFWLWIQMQGNPLFTLSVFLCHACLWLTCLNYIYLRTSYICIYIYINICTWFIFEITVFICWMELYIVTVFVLLWITYKYKLSLNKSVLNSPVINDCIHLFQFILDILWSVHIFFRTV